MTLVVDYFFWHLVFHFLDPEDLVAAGGVWYSWWMFAYQYQGKHSIRQKLSRCGKLDIANSGKLYQKISLSIYANIHSLSLSKTTISSDNFITLMKAATYLSL